VADRSVTSFVEIAGVRLEVVRIGQGRPLLLLYGEEALELEAPFLDLLAEGRELIIPSPPGFGRSERPDWVTNPDDIAYLYLDLLDRLSLNGADVLGCSLGGWIALEMATKDAAAFSRMVLVAPYGVRFGGTEEHEIADIWMLHPDIVTKSKWFDPGKGARDYKSMPEDALAIVARNSESFARFCWEPYMHNPKLRHRLQRVTVPVLFVWGENDGIVTPAYGRACADHVPGAKIEFIGQAGHYPHLEQPKTFMTHLRRFLV
jgi:pimeloyl-ACP methyl ester carboxylesterase